MHQTNWVIPGKGFSNRVAGQLLVHCFVMMFLGFCGGFVWLIHLAENVFHILPLPRIEIAVPDRGELLRNAHTGPMMNAMYAMAIVLLSPRLNFSAVQAKWVYYATIVTLWGNLIGYSTAVLPSALLMVVAMVCGHLLYRKGFALMPVVLVGFAIGMTRTVVPALAESEFGRGRGYFRLLAAFVVAFVAVKAVMIWYAPD